jgi:capsular exopolysaccharide synthesis family protein
VAQRRFQVQPDSPSADPFRTLRLAIAASPAASEIKGLVFASPRQGDGRSTIAANYALVTALVQRPVLLIDADMRNPSLHELFGCPRSPGLVDALRERLDPWDVTHSFPSLGGLHLMTAGSPPSHPGDIAPSAAMGELLRRAYADCDAVVLDSPPVSLTSDALGLASHVATAVVMVVNRSGRRGHTARALRKLESSNANILGLVVNREAP